MPRINQVLLFLAVVILAWASYLSFGFTDNPDLTEDAFGWGFLGLMLGFASSFDFSKYHR